MKIKKRVTRRALGWRDWGAISGVVLGVFVLFFVQFIEEAGYARGVFLHGVPPLFFLFVYIVTSVFCGVFTMISCVMLQFALGKVFKNIGLLP